MVPSGALPLAFSTVIVAWGLVLVAVTVKAWELVDQVALVRWSVSVGATVRRVLSCVPRGARVPL